MKLKLLFTILLIFVISLLSISADAAIYRKTDFIDCGTSCLDSVDGIAINNNSMPALGIVSTEPEHAVNPSQHFFYLWDSDSDCTESTSPTRTYIIPNTNANSGCWVLLGINLDITGNLDMNDNAVTDIGYLDFNLLNGISAAVGRMVWNPDDGTVNIGLLGGNVNLQVGQELVIRAKNDSGSLMEDGTAVRISGASGENPEIDLSEADVLATAESVGLTTEDIGIGQSGYVTTFGLVRGLDTTGTDEGESWSDGDRLYLSNTAGEMTNILPTSTERTVFMGVILRSHASLGVIWLHPLNVYFLDELSDVDVDSPVDDDFMQYNSGTGLWERLAGTDYNTLTNDSLADGLHSHSDIRASDGSPDPACSADATGDLTCVGSIISDGEDNRITFKSGMVIDADDNGDDTITMSGRNIHTHQDFGVHSMMSAIASVASLHSAIGYVTPATTETDLINDSPFIYNNIVSSEVVAKGDIWIIDGGGGDEYLCTGVGTCDDDPNYTFLDGAVGFAVGAWVEVVDTAGSQVIASKYDSGANREWKLHLNSTEDVLFDFYDASEASFCGRITTAGLSVGWHFILADYDGTGGVDANDTIIIYVDGVAVAMDAAVGCGTYSEMEDSSASFLIGGQDAGAVPFQGDIGPVFLRSATFGTAMYTAEQVKQMYQIGKLYLEL